MISALKYYLTSVPTLFSIINLWKIPLLFIKKPILLKLKNGLRFYIETVMDVWVIKEIILDRQYERLRPVKKEDSVIDIGAAFGDFSIYAAQKAKRVYAYDPNSHRIDLLKKNMIINNCHNITVINQAATSLDEILKKNKISHCHFLKIDCEGAEYTIFQKASKESLKKIDHIAFEIHLFTPRMHRSYAKLKNLLAANGFELRECSNAVHNYLKFLFATRVSRYSI